MCECLDKNDELFLGVEHMQWDDGQIITKQKFPSPNPQVDLYTVTYMSDGFKVKGLLAEPKEGGKYGGFLYLRGGSKMLVKYVQAGSSNLQ